MSHEEDFSEVFPEMESCRILFSVSRNITLSAFRRLRAKQCGLCESSCPSYLSLWWTEQNPPPNFTKFAHLSTPVLITWCRRGLDAGTTPCLEQQSTLLEYRSDNRVSGMELKEEALLLWLLFPFPTSDHSALCCAKQLTTRHFFAWIWFLSALTVRRAEWCGTPKRQRQNTRTHVDGKVEHFLPGQQWKTSKKEVRMNDNTVKSFCDVQGHRCLCLAIHVVPSHESWYRFCRNSHGQR